MFSKLTNLCVVFLLSGGCAFAQPDQIEPAAGSWKTWVISSGKDFRVPPPPEESATAAELVQLREQLAKSDTQIADQITFWDAGSPWNRWIELVNTRESSRGKRLLRPAFTIMLASGCSKTKRS